MPTTRIEIDDELLRRAQTCSGLASKQAVVETALRSLIRIGAYREALELGGTIEFWEDYDPEEGDEPIEWNLDDPR